MGTRRMGEGMQPKILFEDTHVLVLSKPAGLLSQGEITGDANLVDWCRAHFGRNYVGLVHRLDRFTSGLMVVGKRSKAAERLTKALQDGELVRVYRAILEGELKGEAEWRHHLKKNESTNTSSVVRAGTTGAKEAVLHVKPISLKKVAGLTLTLAEFRLETGRSHQIRAQAAAMGLPLLGDTKYGAKYGGNSSALKLDRPALHSARMEFPHPMTKEILSFTEKLPSDLAAFVD
jgi:23S rRNA pseudouridine1911/1915/1917 synthase